MKKFLKAAAGVLLAVCLVTGIAGCSEFDLAGEGTAYGVVGSYVGFITVRTDAEGKVTNVIIDEMQTPEHWAEISAFDEADDGDFFAATKPDAKRWAKKIVIGGKVFEAIGTAEGVYPDYRLAEYNNGVGLLEWLRSGLNAKWYVEQMKLGNYGVSKRIQKPQRIEFGRQVAEKQERLLGARLRLGLESQYRGDPKLSHAKRFCGQGHCGARRR